MADQAARIRAEALIRGLREFLESRDPNNAVLKEVFGIDTLMEVASLRVAAEKFVKGVKKAERPVFDRMLKDLQESADAARKEYLENLDRATKKHRPEVSPAAGDFVQEGGWPTLLDLPTVGENKELVTFVKFKNGCFEPQVEERMLRCNEHPRIWRVVQEKIEESESISPKGSRPLGVLIKGHPGIGKTMTLDFLLSWSLRSQPNRAVIVVSADGFTVFFVTPEGAKERYHAPTHSTSVGALLSLLVKKLRVPKGSTILVLHDLKTVASLPYQCALITKLHKSGFNVVCVVASSPEESNYKDFEKDTDALTYCVPVLSYEEARAFASVVRPGEADSVVENDYFKVGGVPRYLCSAETVDEAYKKQELALATLKWKSTSNPFFDATFDDTNIKLMCPIPSEDRTEFIAFDFVSAAVRKRWLEKSAGAAMKGLQ